MNQLTEAAQQNLAPLTAKDIQANVNLIQEVMQQVMKKDVHYGTIAGCGDKPTLFKAGAEKLAATFRLSVDPVVEDLSTSDEVRYRVRVNLIASNGSIVGSGIGECSSNETKYKWRAATCEGEFNATPENKRREAWKRGWNGKPDYQIKQVRTEPADNANTVLKMAKKRGLVDVVLTSTAASDLFTQDIEDLPEEYTASAPGQTPTQSSEPEQTLLPVYPDEKFQENIDLWKARFKEGSSSSKHIMDMIGAKYTLTEEQIKQIKEGE